MNEQTLFLNTVFLCSEFKLENIYSEKIFLRKMFAVIFICENLFLRMAGKTAKISCHTVLHKVAVPLKWRSLNRPTSSKANISRPGS